MNGAWQKKDLLLVTGHTHQPVFESLTYIERLYKQLAMAELAADEAQLKIIREEIQKRKFEYSHVSEDYRSMKPTYFNSGCCCYNDGDITGLEISDGHLRLVKWAVKQGKPKREILEEEKLEVLLAAIA